MLPGQIISRFGDVPWPPRSHDLSVCGFLWEYLKSRVYNHRSRNLDELKTTIIEEIAAILAKMLVRDAQDFEKRLELWIQNDGHRLDDIIFHKYDQK